MARAFVSRVPQLTAKLKQLRQKTQAPVRAALGEAAGEMVAMMRRIVPDGPGTGERDLGNSIKWHFGAEAGGGSDATTGKSGATTATITAGDDKNPEARWVEFGTRPHINLGEMSGTQHPGTPPQPYFFVSYRALRKKAKSRVRKAINEAIKQVAHK